MEPDSTNTSIPVELCTEILSYLPVKSLLRFISVSKDWQSAIENPEFISLHFTHCTNNHLEPYLLLLKAPFGEGAGEPRAQQLNHCDVAEQYREFSEVNFPVLPPLLLEGLNEESKIAGDVNGLLLVQKKLKHLVHGDIVLWNPSINKCISIPLPPDLPELYPNLCLGFDPFTNDYKVLSISHDEFREPASALDIFTLNSRSWRRASLDGLGEELCRLKCFGIKKVSLEESTHWIGYSMQPENYKVLISFNMTTETFTHTPMPKIPINCTSEVDLVAGCLVGLLTWCVDGRIDIWVLQKSGCWKRRYKLELWKSKFADSMSLGKQFFYVGKKAVLLWAISDDESSRAAICVYNARTAKETVVSNWCREFTLYVGVYKESLVLLN